MSLFLGIGLGPIQTGIFLSGAAKGGFSRIVIAELDEKIKKAVNNSGGEMTVNIAGADKVYTERIEGVEVYSPADKDELEKLIEAAAEADEAATALPSINIFPHVAPWLKKGFDRNPAKRRFIYTAENHNHAAEELEKAIGTEYPATFYLNTVVGKMSGVVPASDCEAQKLALLAPGADRGHLVEEFNRILISSCPGIEKRKVQGLYDKKDLYPFEEAKLYGHNAIHFLLGLLAEKEGKTYMSELSGCPEIMSFAQDAFIDESGRALCKKWAGVDELFTPAGYREYALDLLKRMTNPFLKDATNRITRDLPRKMGWQDRMTGTMRVVSDQGFRPEKLAGGAAIASVKLFGHDIAKIKDGLAEIWPSPWTDEHEKLFSFISEALEKQI